MEQFFSNRILPAVTFTDASKAILVAKAILDGGLDIMEVPFRTDAAAESIKIIKENFPKLVIGAGTLTTTKQVEEAKKAGAQFGLAPGFNSEIVKAAIANDLPFIPGVMTPSEVEMAFELGCNIQKLFPAAQAGGTAMLKALAGPYGHLNVKFIPMGGVSLKNMKEYLELNNVLAIGGSWLATKQLIEENQFDQIQENVKEALLRTVI